VGWRFLSEFQNNNRAQGPRPQPPNWEEPQPSAAETAAQRPSGPGQPGTVIAARNELLGTRLAHETTAGAESEKRRGRGAAHVRAWGGVHFIGLPFFGERGQRAETCSVGDQRGKGERTGMERKGREGKGREGKGREGEGREGRGGEGGGGRGREGEGEGCGCAAIMCCGPP